MSSVVLPIEAAVADDSGARTNEDLPQDTGIAAPIDHAFAYKQVHPPTGVTHACSGTFTAAAARKDARPDIIIVRATQLELWRVRQTKEGNHRLEEVVVEQLWGVVQSLAVLNPRHQRVGRDALLLTFRGAKLSVLQWDDSTERFWTSGLHSWEAERGLRGGRCRFPMGPQAVTDPQGRCAAVLLYGRHLALLPATGADDMDLDDSSDEAPTDGHRSGAALQSSRIVDLLELGIQQIRDLKFLHGYNEPTLLILHEVDRPTWAGRLVERRDTCALTAVSVRPSTGARTRIWGAAGLPSDAQCLMAVPAGGCLVACVDLLLFYTQGNSCALAVSSKAIAGIDPPALELKEMVEPAAVTAAKHAARYCNNVPPAAVAELAKTAPRADGIDVQLTECVSSWLDSRTTLIGCASGHLLVATVPSEGGIVRRIMLSKASAGAPASALTTVGPGLVFLGSWLADSLLLQTTRTAGHAPLLLKNIDDTDIYNEKKAVPTLEQAAAAPPTKKPKLEENDSDDDSEEELRALFDVAEVEGDTNAAPKLSVRALDALPGLGPIRSLVLAPPPARLLTGESTDAANEGPPVAVAAVGIGKRGGLAVLHRGVVPQLVLEPIPLRGTSGLWSVFESGQSQTSAHHAFLLISSGETTRVMDGRGGALDELSGDSEGFILTSPTLAAANLQPEGALGRAGPIVQVCPRDVRLLTAGAAVQTLSLAALLPPEADGTDEDLVIEAAHVAGCYVALRLTDGTAIILFLPPGSNKVEVLQSATQALTLRPTIDFPAAVTAIYLTEDRSGWLTTHGHNITDLSAGSQENLSAPMVADTTEAMDVGESASPPTTSPDASSVPATSPTENLATSTHTNDVMESSVEVAAAAAGATSRVSTAGEGMPLFSDPTAVGVGPLTIPVASAQQQQQQQAKPLADAAEEGLHQEKPPMAWPNARPNAGASSKDGPTLRIPETEQTSEPERSSSATAPTLTNSLTIFASVTRASGALEVYRLPDMQLILSASGLPAKAALLAMPSVTNGCGDGGEPDGEGAEFSDVSVRELLLECLLPPGQEHRGVVPGSCEDRVGAAPHLMATLSDDTVVEYRAFSPPQGGLAFKRQPVRLDGCGAASEAAAAGGPSGRQMSCFYHIGEVRRYCGVFIGGARPMWLISDRGRLVPHAAGVDGAVSAFTPFHNATCERGFITAAGDVAATSSLHICQLDPMTRLDTHMPLRRLPQRGTVTAVGYYPEARLHIAGTSRQSPFKAWRPLEAGGDATAAAAYATAEAAARTVNSCHYGEVRLVSPSSGKTAARYGLEAGEVVLSVTAVHLSDSSTMSHTRPLIAVGTSFSAGEDFPCTGRLMLFEVKPQEKTLGSDAPTEHCWTMPLLFVREFRGAVMAVEAVEGALAVVAGTRLEVYVLAGSSLRQTAFHDAPFLLTAMRSHGAYLLAGGASHGVTFFHYHGGKGELQQLSRDWEGGRVCKVDILRGSARMHFAASDNNGGILLQRYDTDVAHAAQTGGGARLLDLAGVNLGHGVTATASERVAAKQSLSLDMGILMGTDGGGLISLAAFSTTTDRQHLATLAAMSRALAIGVAHCCGLNPLSFRRLERKDKIVAGRHAAGLALNGDLLGVFLSLSTAQQEAIAQQAGVTIDAAKEAFVLLLQCLEI